jgi:hypothetical protein
MWRKPSFERSKVSLKISSGRGNQTYHAEYYILTLIQTFLCHGSIAIYRLASRCIVDCETHTCGTPSCNETRITIIRNGQLLRQPFQEPAYTVRSRPRSHSELPKMHTSALRKCNYDVMPNRVSHLWGQELALDTYPD